MVESNKIKKGVEWMKTMVSISTGMVFLGILFLIGTVQAADKQTIIKRIKDNYKELTSFQADIYIERIEQGKELEGEGKIWAKEDKFRMEIEEIASDSGEKEASEKRVIVFDGTIFWIYSQPKNELFSIDLSKLTDLSDLVKGQLQEIVKGLEEGVLNFFSPQFSPEEEIEISENEWKGTSFYVLRHGQTETWVNKEDYFIYRIITYDETENVISDVQLTVINLNEKISDELFTFQVPEGVQPLDMVEIMKGMFEVFEEEGAD